jgi:hypothetical protein
MADVDVGKKQIKLLAETPLVGISYPQLLLNPRR